jgi:hypothetical protein
MKRHISTLLDQINQFKDEKVNPSILRAIALAKDSKLCVQCAKKPAKGVKLDNGTLHFHSVYLSLGIS